MRTSLASGVPLGRMETNAEMRCVTTKRKPRTILIDCRTQQHFVAFQLRLKKHAGKLLYGFQELIQLYFNNGLSNGKANSGRALSSGDYRTSCVVRVLSDETHSFLP